MTHRRRAPSFAFWSALLLVASGFVALAWAVWPLPVHKETIPLGALPELLPETTSSSAPGPKYSLQLEYPRMLRLGSRSSVTANLEPEGTFTAGSLPPNTNLVVVAHIQSNDVLLDPNGDIMEPLLSSTRASFAWQAVPLRRGDLESTLFIRLELVPQEAGVVTARTIFARVLPMRGAALLGMTSTTATAFGVAALLTGGVLLLGAMLGRSSRREAAR